MGVARRQGYVPGGLAGIAEKPRKDPL